MDDDDLIELKTMFLDECLENIELLEQGLMRMLEGEGGAETVNDVFRAAHSIKGGAATFDFIAMSQLTHYMETLLDEMRSGNRPVNGPDVDLLLVALDLVQSILEAARNGEDADHEERAAVQAQLQASVDAGSAAANPSNIGEAEDQNTASGIDGTITDSVPVTSSWRIGFAPKPDLIKLGNEPLLLLRELARLGELTLSVNTDALPDWSDYDPAQCYLSWNATLTGPDEQSKIAEIFDWVDTECDLKIEALSASDDSSQISSQQDSGQQDKDDSSASPPIVSAKAKPNDAKAPDTKSTEPRQTRNKSESSSIRIATDKIDQLINLVGELVITQSMLTRVGFSNDSVDLDELRERLTDLEHNTRDLQESVMQVRMLPLSSAFSRFPRLVRDLSRKLDKDVELVLEGGTTELDKTVLERMIDPLVHLVRNALDHGLENATQRAAAGKPKTGRLEINARQESGSIIIEIIDDGKGIDCDVILSKAIDKGVVSADETLSEEQIQQLIFAPGFSTAETVSDVSGRGVGMDVVKRNILDLSGRVAVRSTLGTGTTIKIELPLSLAIMEGQLVRLADQLYVIPILSIIETLETTKTEVSDVPGYGEVCLFRGTYIPIIRLAERFEVDQPSTGALIVIVDTPGMQAGLLVDAVDGQQQVVVKPLVSNYRKVPGLAGATIMSDGSVSLILDPSAIVATEFAPEGSDAPLIKQAA